MGTLPLSLTLPRFIIFAISNTFFFEFFRRRQRLFFSIRFSEPPFRGARAAEAAPVAFHSSSAQASFSPAQLHRFRLGARKRLFLSERQRSATCHQAAQAFCPLRYEFLPGSDQAKPVKFSSVFS